MEPEQRPRTEDWYPLVQRTRVPATKREKSRADQRHDSNRNRHTAADRNRANDKPRSKRQTLRRAETKDPASTVARKASFVTPPIKLSATLRVQP